MPHSGLSLNSEKEGSAIPRDLSTDKMTSRLRARAGLFVLASRREVGRRLRPPTLSSIYW